MAIKYYGLKKIEIADFKDIKDPAAELKQLKQSVGEYKSALNTKAEEVDKLIDELDATRIESFGCLQRFNCLKQWNARMTRPASPKRNNRNLKNRTTYPLGGTD